MRSDSFVLGKDVVPVWFNDEANKGRVRITYDEYRNIQSAIILSGVKRYEAKIGDTIVHNINGLVVIPKQEEVKPKKVEKVPYAKVIKKEEDSNEEGIQ